MKNRKLFSFIVILVTIFCLLIIFHYTRVFSPFETLFVSVSQPFQRVVYSTLNRFYIPSQSHITQNDYDLLVKKYEFLVVQSGQYQEVIEENRALRDLLNFQENVSMAIVTGSITGGSTDGITNSRIVNVGYNDGVRKGAPVITGEGIIIGTVIEVTQAQSVFLFLTDNTSKVASTILNKDHTIGVVQGNFNTGMVMEYIPQSELVTTNDIIVTSGLDTIIPKGLIIGTVSDVIAQDADLFKKAIIKPIVDFNKVQTVAIIIGNKE